MRVATARKLLIRLKNPSTRLAQLIDPDRDGGEQPSPTIPSGSRQQMLPLSMVMPWAANPLPEGQQLRTIGSALAAHHPIYFDIRLAQRLAQF